MFVAFHKTTTKFLRVWRQGYWQNARYETQAGCTRAINAAAKRGDIKASDYKVLPIEEFLKIERSEIVINMMSGKEVVQSVNTPMCCDPSTETYWSM